MHATAVLATIDWAASAASPHRFLALGVHHGMTGRQERPQEGLHHCRQVHGTRVVEASAARTGTGATVRVEADAIYSTTPGTAVAVRTADCLPVLLCEPSGRVVLAAHAGWRGLTAGILACSIGTLAEQGVAAHQLHALLGPAIGRERFQVGTEVVDAIRGPDLGLTPTQAALATAKGAGDRWHVDLAVAAVFTLVNGGLAPQNVTVIQECTHQHADRWYSFRREGKSTGSNWSWITAR